MDILLDKHKAWQKRIRNNDAKALKYINNCIKNKNNPKFRIDWETIIIIGSIVLLIIIASCVHPKPIYAYTDEEAIKTLVGEASNQGYTGMVAVGEVIRKRGSLKGFYGLTAKHSANEPKWVWAMAKKAWKASETSNLTHGATYMENVKAFGMPYWCKDCVVTARIGSHTFYRRKNG